VVLGSHHQGSKTDPRVSFGSTRRALPEGSSKVLVGAYPGVLSAGLFVRGTPGQGPLAAQASAFSLAHRPPDPKLLAVIQGVFEAVLADHTPATDFLRLLGRRTTLGEEQVRLDPEAVGKIPPSSRLFLIEFDHRFTR